MDCNLATTLDNARCQIANSNTALEGIQAYQWCRIADNLGPAHQTAFGNPDAGMAFGNPDAGIVFGNPDS